MASLLGELQSEYGYLHHRSALTRTVGATPELIRIRDLPRRDWREDPDLPELVRLGTLVYKFDRTLCQPLCEGCKAHSLKPAQATLLREARDIGEGAAGFLRVGAGKTLASFLLPGVMRARRPVLIVPAGQVPKTERALAEYSRHWKIAPFKLVTYEWLSHPNQLGWFKDYAPDLVVADESHKLKDPSSKCARRLGKYMRAGHCKLIVLTGSAAGRSIREYWHYLRWALPSRAPVPSKPLEMNAWAYALDEKVPPEARFDPGDLSTLAPVVHDDPLTQARLAYQNRLTSTPGIVSTLEDVPCMGLALEARPVDMPPAIKAALAEMRATWTTPGGEAFSLALDLWRHARTLGCGLYYTWSPQPPREWLAARSAWHQFARPILANARSYDSVRHLKDLIRGQALQDYGVLERWTAIKPTFEPNSVPVWISDYLVRYAAEWLRAGPRRLVWAEQRAFGDELARVAGVPFFAEGGLDAQGRLIDSYSGPCVASIHTCREGHNLQQAYSEALFPSPLSKGDRLEQALGRMHRDGQEADEVRAVFLLTCTESYECLAQACLDAKFMEETSGQAAKLCYASWEPRDIQSLLTELKEGTKCQM